MVSLATKMSRIQTLSKFGFINEKLKDTQQRDKSSHLEEQKAIWGDFPERINDFVSPFSLYKCS